MGHLLTHIARNADSVPRRVEGAARNVVADQYPGGPAGRAAEIEAGANRSARELLDTSTPQMAPWRRRGRLCPSRGGRACPGT